MEEKRKPDDVLDDDAVIDDDGDDAELEDEPDKVDDEGETEEVETGEDGKKKPKAGEKDDEEEDEPQGKGPVTLTRAEFNQLLQSRGRSEPPPNRERDPLVEELTEVLNDKSVPTPLRKVLVTMHERLEAAEHTARRATSEAVAVRGVPESHLPKVRAIAERFGLPIGVAHQLYKGQLYDAAVARRRDKRSRETDEEETPKSTPERTGAARHTSLRPARTNGTGGGEGPAITIRGVRIPKEFKSSAEYARFMDGLPSDEHRRVVYKARLDGKTAIRG